MRMKVLIAVGVLGVVVLAGWWFTDSQRKSALEQETVSKKKTQSMAEAQPGEKEMAAKDALMKQESETAAGAGSAMMPKETSAAPSPGSDGMVKSEGAMMENPDRYVSYSKGIIEKFTGKRRVLFFYANWCPLCKPADADLSARKAEIPSDVVVIRVNYNDTETDADEKVLASQYGVTYQHTFVQIDQSGTVVTKWNGGKLDELIKNIK